jgi:hypothetical protein
VSRSSLVYGVCLILLAVCGCADQNTLSHLLPTDSAGAAGSPTSGNAGSNGLSGVDNGSGLVGDAGLISNDAGSSASGQCGASTFAAQQVVVETETQVMTQVSTVKPVALYIMLDQSLSMTLSGIWKPAVSAIKAFTLDSKSAGIDVGLQYFPISGGQCATGAGYSTPEVPVAALPGQASNIAASLDAHNASAIGTPIEGALRGVTEFCKHYQADHPSEQCVSVLVTDGKPELSPGCNENQDQLAAIAAAAHTAGVTTFAVGLKGADFTLLDKIAKQGGAPDCDPNAATYACDVSTGADKLVTALASIRDTVVTTETHTEIVKQVQQSKLPCEWVIPTPPAGQMFDPNKVNIRLTVGDSQTNFFRVDSASLCTANAWHFDDPKAPTRLVACPETCNRISAAVSGKVDILLGCETLGPQ